MRRKVEWVRRNIVLSKPLDEKLREIAKKHQVSQSEVIRRLLLNYLEKVGVENEGSASITQKLD